MIALGCNQIMDCSTPPVHSRCPWAAWTSMDRSARYANARVHARVRMGNVCTHTEPSPYQDTHLWHVPARDFYRWDFLAKAVQICPDQDGNSDLLPWAFCNSCPASQRLHHVGCTMLHDAPLRMEELPLIAHQSCWSSSLRSSRDARAFERLWERSLACNSTANFFTESVPWCSMYAILGNTNDKEESFSQELSCDKPLRKAPQPRIQVVSPAAMCSSIK